MGPFTLDNYDKLQYDDIVVNWVLYSFHDDIIIMTLIVVISRLNRRHLVWMKIYFVVASPLCRRRIVRTSPNMESKE